LIRNAMTEKPSWINLKTTRIYPIDMVPKDEGYLHDGTKVIKKFGQWVDARNPDVRLDPAYYPEIVQDRVMSRIEWQQHSQTPSLPSSEVPAIETRGVSEPESIGDLMHTDTD
jgi:hypothetical protein